MELVTYLNPGAFNAVKFVILYVLVDNIFVWARGKLKRAVNVASIIEGAAVPVASITGNDGRNTVSAIIQNFKDMKINWRPGSAGSDVADGAEWPWMTNSLRRTAPFAVIRFTPLFILLLVFMLDFGTGSVNRCQHKPVQFAELAEKLSGMTGSLKCTRFLERTRANNGTEFSFRIEYFESARVENSTLCGCDFSTTVPCISKFRGVGKQGPKIAIWNTGAQRYINSTASENTRRARVAMLRKVRRDFNFPGKIPWKTYVKTPRKSELLISCFSYSDEVRSAIACVRENATITRTQALNDILLMVKTMDAVSFIQLSTVNENQFAVQNLAGILDDGQLFVWRGLGVYRTNSEGMFRLKIDSMFTLLLLLLIQYNIIFWGIALNDAIEMIKMITTFAGILGQGEGTLRSCTGTILTLNSVGIAAAILLLLLLFLIFGLTLIASPESFLSLFSRGNALESWQWTVDALLSEKAGSGISWSPAHGIAFAILERTPELELKISSAEEQGSACTAAEIPLIL